MHDMPDDYEIMRTGELFFNEYVELVNMVGRFSAFLSLDKENSSTVYNALKIMGKKMHELQKCRTVEDVQKQIKVRKAFKLYRGKISSAKTYKSKKGAITYKVIQK